MSEVEGPLFADLDWRGARFREIDFSGAVMRGVEMVDVTVDGEVERLVVNGVDVAPLVEAELDRRDPERAMMRPADADGFRAAWTVLERRWEDTVARARTLPPDLLRESVGGEWSFVQTLRHLVFATDSWVSRALLGEAAPWHPLALPWDAMTPDPAVPWDRDAQPSLDEVLAVRAERQGVVRSVLADLTDERLTHDTETPAGSGWPPPGSTHPVALVLRIVLREEWEHRGYAERDLDALAMRFSGS